MKLTRMVREACLWVPPNGTTLHSLATICIQVNLSTPRQVNQDSLRDLTCHIHQHYDIRTIPLITLVVNWRGVLAGEGIWHQMAHSSCIHPRSMLIAWGVHRWVKIPTQFMGPLPGFSPK